jgi:transketolase
MNARALSRLGPRGAFGLALVEAAKRDDRVVALTADLAQASGLDRFRRTYPNRFWNVGIAEQNLVGVERTDYVDRV